jgi:hypothetical protein
MFSRVFQSPGGFYSDRLKHVIGPEVSWVYRTRVDDPESIPKFDHLDTLLGTSEITYGIVQQVFARRRAENGKPYPYEFFSWRIQQTYYVKISDGQNAYDPNYSSSAFAPGRVPAHRSPLLSRMRLRPRPGVAADFTFEYDVNYKQPVRMGFGLMGDGPNASLRASWSQITYPTEPTSSPALTRPTSSMLSGAGTVRKLPGGFGLDASVYYDFSSKELYHASAKLKWEVNCCGFAAEVVRMNWGGVEDWSWRFSLNLANVGAMGNFLGVDSQSQQGPLGGTR